MQAPRTSHARPSAACEVFFGIFIAQRVAEHSRPSVLFGVPAGSGRCSLLLLLVHLRGVAAIVTVGRHHHRALSCEGLGHRLALPAAAPTHRALVDASQQGAQLLPDRSWRAPCGRWAPSASFTSILDALKLACRSCSLQARISPRPPLSRCCRRCSRRALQAVAPAYEVTTGGCEDVVSRASICRDSTDLYSTHGRRRPAHGRTPTRGRRLGS